MSAAEPQSREHAAILRCEHGERCGGCALLGVPMAEQRARKREAVERALRRYRSLAGLAVAELEPATNELEYRTRVKLVVSRAGEIGLYARASHEVVDIPGCRVMRPRVREGVAWIRARLRARGARLSAIDVREAQGQLLVTLIGEERALPELERFGLELCGEASIASVAVSARAEDVPAFFGEAPQIVAGESAILDRLLDDGPHYFATHGGFVQAHPGQAAALAGSLLRELDAALGGLRGARVLELYAGAGALSLQLRARGAELVLNERFAPALELAERAAREQGLSERFAVRAGDAAEIATELAARGQRFDAVVANPPRAGLPPAVRRAIAALAPRAIVYVSCAPATLARDLDHFAWLGYGAATLQPFDMMPLTDSIESLAWLRPAAPPALRVLYEDEALLAVDKPAHISTTPEAEGPDSVLDRLRAQRRLGELQPVHRLDRGTSGVCLFAKQGADVPELAAALASGEKRYLALVRGITRDKGSVRRPLREGRALREARTRYRRLEVLAGHSLLELRPDQGRKHQIRRHLAAIGHPVLGDARHGDAGSNRYFEQKHGLDRCFLHLARIELPANGARHALTLEAELPGDLAQLIDRLRTIRSSD